jgi:hypothetical protein
MMQISNANYLAQQHLPFKARATQELKYHCRVIFCEGIHGVFTAFFGKMSVKWLCLHEVHAPRMPNVVVGQQLLSVQQH